jgi:hypothetical protein
MLLVNMDNGYVQDGAYGMFDDSAPPPDDGQDASYGPDPMDGPPPDAGDQGAGDQGAGDPGAGGQGAGPTASQIMTITASGYNGSDQVSGSYTRVGQTANWVEVNSQGTNHFTAISVTDSALILFDASRNIYLLLDLNAQTVSFAGSPNGPWSVLYRITSTTAAP